MKVLEEQVQLAQVVVLKVGEVVCGPWKHVLKARGRFPAAVERAQQERLTRLVVRRRKELRAPPQGRLPLPGVGQATGMEGGGGGGVVQ